MSGFLGNYVTDITTDEGKVETIQHGVVIIATGGTEYKPAEYLYGQSPEDCDPTGIGKETGR